MTDPYICKTAMEALCGGSLLNFLSWRSRHYVSDVHTLMGYRTAPVVCSETVGGVDEE
jgi:hypothetical protein